ncbi:hypothetical protein DID78_01690 [Candidatus Marinamargulisbacteria bacterium SCGC AG-343-D04]|nr:hypothetical protein DID78_01690 [Candidatus Marinamargulisbacteria bacterium SCGC AG-343-D04]
MSSVARPRSAGSRSAVIPLNTKRNSGDDSCSSCSNGLSQDVVTLESSPTSTAASTTSREDTSAGADISDLKALLAEHKRIKPEYQTLIEEIENDMQVRKKIEDKLPDSWKEMTKKDIIVSYLVEKAKETRDSDYNVTLNLDNTDLPDGVTKDTLCNEKWIKDLSIHLGFTGNQSFIDEGVYSSDSEVDSDGDSDVDSGVSDGELVDDEPVYDEVNQDGTIAKTISELNRIIKASRTDNVHKLTYWDIADGGVVRKPSSRDDDAAAKEELESEIRRLREANSLYETHEDVLGKEGPGSQLKKTIEAFNKIHFENTVAEEVSKVDQFVTKYRTVVEKDVNLIKWIEDSHQIELLANADRDLKQLITELKAKQEERKNQALLKKLLAAITSENNDEISEIVIDREKTKEALVNKVAGTLKLSCNFPDEFYEEAFNSICEKIGELEGHEVVMELELESPSPSPSSDRSRSTTPVTVTSPSLDSPRSATPVTAPVTDAIDQPTAIAQNQKLLEELLGKITADNKDKISGIVNRKSEITNEARVKEVVVELKLSGNFSADFYDQAVESIFAKIAEFEELKVDLELEVPEGAISPSLDSPRFTTPAPAPDAIAQPKASAQNQKLLDELLVQITQKNTSEISDIVNSGDKTNEVRVKEVAVELKLSVNFSADFYDQAVESIFAKIAELEKHKVDLELEVPKVSPSPSRPTTPAPVIAAQPKASAQDQQLLKKLLAKITSVNQDEISDIVNSGDKTNEARLQEVAEKLKLSGNFFAEVSDDFYAQAVDKIYGKIGSIEGNLN